MNSSAKQDARLIESITLSAGRALLGARSPAGAKARLTILIFHRVRREPDPLFPGEPDAKRFAQDLRVVTGLFNVLPLSQALRDLRKGTLLARAAAITFDDGYADNVDVALPILQRHGLQATFFIATGFLDGGRMWNDTIIESVRAAPGDVLDLTALGLPALAIGTIAKRRQAIELLIQRNKYLPMAEREDRCLDIARIARASLPADLMLRTDQVRQLHTAGMEIGAHTVSHPILSALPEAVARREIADSRDHLGAITASPVRLFAYPNGRPRADYRGEHVRIVRSLGFDAAVSTSSGAATRKSDPLQLPRFTPWDRSVWKMALRFHRNLRHAIDTV